MPELPDVENFKRYFSEHTLHQKITAVEIDEPDLLEEISAGQLKERLVGQKFVTTYRHGKHLFAGLNSQDWLRFHFGMTGFLKYFDNLGQRPDHVRLELQFENESRLAFDCQRKLGEIGYVAKVETFLEENDLGPDVLAEDFDYPAFETALGDSRAMLKNTLMDQSRLAGIGNIYADEITFQTNHHPKKKTRQLDETQLRELHAAARGVLQTAVRCLAENQGFPGDYIIPHRDEGASCPRCQAEIERIEVSGRGTYICPECQEE